MPIKKLDYIDYSMTDNQWRSNPTSPRYLVQRLLKPGEMDIYFGTHEKINELIDEIEALKNGIGVTPAGVPTSVNNVTLEIIKENNKMTMELLKFMRDKDKSK